MTSFIKKYQRPLMLVLAVFALLTFSITPAMGDAVEKLFSKEIKRGTITLPDGRVYKITEEDRQIAQDLHRVFVERVQGTILQSFMALDLGMLTEEEEEEREKELQEGEKPEEPRYMQRLVLLYCLAKESGLQLTDGPVEQFAQSFITSNWLQVRDKASYRKNIPRIFGVSPAYFERLLKEYARIELYRDLLCLGENTAIASVLDRACEEGEELQVEVVRWEAEDFAAQVKEEKVTDEELEKFLTGLEEAEKRDFLEAKVMKLALAHLPLETKVEQLRESVAEGKPGKDSPGAAFLEVLDKLPAPTEADLKADYERDKGKLYRKQLPDLDTPARQALEEKKVEAELPEGTTFRQALDHFTLRTGVEAVLSEEAGKLLQEGKAPVTMESAESLTGKAFLEKLLEPHPDLAWRVRRGKVRIHHARKESAPETEEVEYIPFAEVEEKVAARKALSDALKVIHGQVLEAAKGEEFDFKAYLGEHFPLFKLEETPLQNLGKLLEKGVLKNWGRSMEAEGAAEGDILPDVYTSDEAWFMGRLLEVKENVPRPLAEIREELRLLYNEKEARKRAEAAADDFFTALKKKGGKAQPDKIAAIDKEIEEALAKRMESFTGRLEKDMARARAIIADPVKHEKVKEHWRRSLAAMEEKKGLLAEKRKEFRRQEEEKREEEKEKVRLEKAGDFFTATAKEMGVPVHESGWFPKNLHRIDPDLVEEQEEEALRYAMGSEGVAKVEELEEGRITEVIEEITDKAYMVIKLVGRRKRKVEDLTPGEIRAQLQRRKREVEREFSKSFLDFETLKAFTHYRDYQGEEEEGAGEGEALKKQPAAPPGEGEPKEEPGRE